MATQEQINQFFATKPGKPNKIKINGKFSFNRLPKDVQEKVKKRLAEKDEIMEKGKKGILPGIKIDGKQVTRDNIHEFEIKEKPKKIKKPKKVTKSKKAPKKTAKKTNKIVKAVKKIVKKEGQ